MLLAAQQKAAAATVCHTGLKKRSLEAGEDCAYKVRRLDMTSIMNGSQKQERMDLSVSDDEPLDFSLKTMESRSHSFLPVSAASDNNEPMDLSIGATRSRPTTDPDTSDLSPISLVVASKRSSAGSQSTASASESAISSKWNVTKAPRPYQCTHCHAVFVHSSKVQRRSLLFVILFVIFVLFLAVAQCGIFLAVASHNNFDRLLVQS